MIAGMIKLKTRNGKSHRSVQWIIGFGILLYSQGCSMQNPIIEKHRKVCMQNMRIIVHDDALWQEYRRQSRMALKEEMTKNPPEPGRNYYTSLGDFKLRFGNKKTVFRTSSPPNEIFRDDAFIMHENKIVAQIVDFTLLLSSIDGSTGFTCLDYYDDLQIKGDDK